VNWNTAPPELLPNDLLRALIISFTPTLSVEGITAKAVPNRSLARFSAAIRQQHC